MNTELRGPTGPALSSTQSADQGEIYIGGTIDTASERDFLKETVKSLQTQAVPFVVLANFCTNDRQIDCVIGTPGQISVIEVKSSHLPVSGDINGPWTICHAGGDEGSYRNGYQQALQAKYAFPRPDEDS